MDYPVEIATDLNRHNKVEDIQMVNKQTNTLNCYWVSWRSISKDSTGTVGTCGTFGGDPNMKVDIKARERGERELASTVIMMHVQGV